MFTLRHTISKVSAGKTFSKVIYQRVDCTAIDCPLMTCIDDDIQH